MSLVVVVVYPDLLGTYGDGGNGLILARRAQWRGIDAEVVEAESGSPLPAGDLYCLGGGEDGPQLRAAELLRSDGGLKGAVERGASVLAVCAGYQIVGRTFPAADGRPVPGVGLLDVWTVKGAGRRAVGELLADPVPGALVGGALAAGAVASGALADGALADGGQDEGRAGGSSASLVALGPGPLSGFENHGGRTALGPAATPLARVLLGVGNGDGTEGAYQGRVVGTYLHGPVLARNPRLADVLLGWATGLRLDPVDDAEEEALRTERLGAVRRGRLGQGRARS